MQIEVAPGVHPASDCGQYHQAARVRQNFSRPHLFVDSHGYHHGDHEPGDQDSEHNIIEGCHTITAKKKAAR
jgi:hypothetical protein